MQREEVTDLSSVVSLHPSLNTSDPNLLQAQDLLAFAPTLHIPQLLKMEKKTWKMLGKKPQALDLRSTPRPKTHHKP
jgi:hypothetical protein